MTRFARYGQGQKPVHDSTKWSNFKSGWKQQNATNIEQHCSNKEEADKTSPLKGVKNDSNFKVTKKNRSQKKFGDVIGKRDFNKLECHNCHKIGHKVADCPEPSDGKQQEVQCYNCKGKGHKAFQCPKGPSDRRNKTNNKFNRSKKIDWKTQRSDHRRLKRQEDSFNKLVMICSFLILSDLGHLFQFLI